MRTWALVFLASLSIAMTTQGVRIFVLPMPDTAIWADEARYMAEGDSRQYDFLGGYGHPGGPILEGVTALHSVGFTYPTAVRLLVYILSCIFTVAIALSCYALRPHKPWWLIETVLLSVSWMYIYATPTIALAALLSLLLFLFTWLIYENVSYKKPSNTLLFVWASSAGLLVSTRVDIGSVLALVFAVYLLLTRRIALRNMLFAAAVAFGIFFATDPFMWRMPISHLQDLAAKVIFQIYYYPLKDINYPGHVMAIFALSVTSILIVGIVAFWRGKHLRAIPNSLYLTVLAVTAVLCPIFMCVQYGSERYFLPIAFIWEALLPITLLTVDPNRKAIQILAWAPAVASLMFSLFFVWIEITFYLPR